MQLTTLIVAALSASRLTIAAPTFNGTDPFAYHEELEGGIEKRGSYGWLSSFQLFDFTCGGGWGGSRPKIQDSCVIFSPVSRRVGINWGQWPLAFDSLDVYSDERCVVKIATIKGPPKHQAKGAQTCVVTAEHGKGKKWRSVRSSAAGPGY
ncbi:hypothetical protein G7Y79_00031g066330 [Physcia stellaris]|nr:hypothetical protein G7Y79_00031g066330 [Physcia stellaris]